MGNDRYTKFVLTVIAVALVVLCIRPLASPDAANALPVSCGTNDTPCVVSGSVSVYNGPSQPISGIPPLIVRVCNGSPCR